MTDVTAALLPALTPLAALADAAFDALVALSAGVAAGTKGPADLAAAPALSVLTTGRVELSAGDLGERVVDLAVVAVRIFVKIRIGFSDHRHHLSRYIIDNFSGSPLGRRGLVGTD